MNRSMRRRLSEVERIAMPVAPTTVFHGRGETADDALIRHRAAFPNSGPILVGGFDPPLSVPEWETLYCNGAPA